MKPMNLTVSSKRTLMKLMNVRLQTILKPIL